MIYKYAIVLLLIFSFQSSIGQRTLRTFDGNNRNMNSSRTMADSMANRASNNVAKNLDAKIEDYKIISRQHDTIYLDTTLTIQKEYKFNYLRRDYFNLLPFNNMGQAFNSLSYDLYNRNMQPGFGSKAKHFNYMGVNEIHYFHVPTPLTELMFKTSFEQGQLLDAFFTVNTSEQFNFSIAYKGMRSLGKYQHILSESRNFRFTSSYHTKNKRYYLRMHLVNQGILNQENGGIPDEQLAEFENGNSEFTDRSLFDPFFEDAESNLEGRRFYLDHSYHLKQKDSLGNH
ncbi:MAG: putative porin, partial [Bacteroidota bacterium]|nr:putative porin [Bacteroidota bacterium]